MIRSRPLVPEPPLVRWAIASGAGMVLISALWWQQRAHAPLWQTLVGDTPWCSVVLGTVVGLAFAAIAWVAFSRSSVGRAILADLNMWLDFQRLTSAHILLIALSAGVGEEVLFRGVIQQHLGLALTALLFGLLHFINLWYVAYATVAGLVLGWLAESTDALLAPIICHALVDGLLLWRAKVWATRHAPGH